MTSSKPLIKMSAPERQRTFDKMGLSIHRNLLDDARVAEPGVGVHSIVVLSHLLPVGRMRLHMTCDYGDGDGINICCGIRDEDYKGRKDIEVGVVTCSFSEQCVPDPVRLDTNFHSFGHVQVAALFLLNDNQEIRLVCQQIEHGDSDGVERQRDTEMSIVRSKLLRPGERLRITVLTFDLDAGVYKLIR